jgi:flagellar biogenesis protein FliO
MPESTAAAAQRARATMDFFTEVWRSVLKRFVDTVRSISVRRRVSSLRLSESLALGERKSIVVVQWEDRRYLLGLTPQTVQLLDSHSALADHGQGPSIDSLRLN